MEGFLFVSYSRVDAPEFALKLADRLMAGPPPYPVWLDRRELRPGEDWDDQIEQALGACRGVLFVLSRDSVDPLSGCKNEWSRALKDKKTVIPLRLHADADLPFRLGSRQYVDFSSGFDAGLAGLRSYLEWTRTSAGQIQELKIRLADSRRELPRADGQRRASVEAEIVDLTHRINELASQFSADHVAHATESTVAGQEMPSGPRREASRATGPGQIITIGEVHGDNINVAGDYRRNG